MLKRIFCSVTAIAVLGIGEGAIAQNLIELGEDKSGTPIFLVQKNPGSTSYKILQSYGSGTLETSLSAYCPANKYFVAATSIYSAKGTPISNEVVQELTVPVAGSIGAKALEIVCRNIASSY